MDSSQAYAETAEFIDVAMQAPWVALGPRVEAVLGCGGIRRQPVVGMGAGTGRGVLAVARALPGAPVVAVEPSAALRAVLLSRIASEAGWATPRSSATCSAAG